MIKITNKYVKIRPLNEFHVGDIVELSYDDSGDMIHALILDHRILYNTSILTPDGVKAVAHNLYVEYVGTLKIE